LDPEPHSEAGREAVRQAAAELYVHCFPLLLTDIVRRAFPLISHEFLLIRNRGGDLAAGLEDDDECLVLSGAWTELGEGPVIAHLPQTYGRFFSLTLIDTAGVPFASLGSRTGHDGGVRLALVGPHWLGELPKDVTVCKAPCSSVWVVSRLYAHSPLDIRKTLDLAAHQSLSPPGKEARASRKPLAALDAPTPRPGSQLSAIDAVTFLHRLDSLLARAPEEWRRSSAAAVAAMRASVEAWRDDMEAELSQPVAAGIADGLAAIRAEAKDEASDRALERPDDREGFAMALTRAAQAYLRLGAPAPKDVSSFVYDRDADGRPLDGGESYRIRFRRDSPPPALAFWRLSPRPAPQAGPRRALGDRCDMRPEADGSCLVFVQSAPPGPARLLNWLPCPNGRFSLTLRLFWPAPSVLRGGWRMPPIERLAPDSLASGPVTGQR